MIPFLFCILQRLLLGLPDANVKGRVVAAADRRQTPWSEVPAFWKDEGLFCWRGLLLALDLWATVEGCRAFGWVYAVHSITMFNQEFWWYWQWIALFEYVPSFRIGQKAPMEWWDVTIGPSYARHSLPGMELQVVVPRPPHLGEVPPKPVWLRIGRLSLMWYHERWVIGLVALANGVLALVVW